MNKDISRRDFLQKSALATAGAVLASSPLLAKSAAGVAEEMAQQVRRPSANDRLNVVGVGIGGRGGADIDGLAKTENIIGLCDVDWKYAGHVFDRYPKAKRFNDYRKMFDKMLDKADAVNDYIQPTFQDADWQTIDQNNWSWRGTKAKRSRSSSSTPRRSGIRSKASPFPP